MLFVRSITTIHNATKYQHCLSNLRTLLGTVHYTSRVKRNPSFKFHDSAMGSSWSAIRSETESSENRIDWTSIESKSVSKLYDPLELSVRLTDDTKSRLRKVGKVGIWKVGFEIDVADMQKRYEICEVHTQLKEDIERLCMTGEMFKSMVDRSGVTIEGICNINALHASLNVGAEEVGICLVVDVCREGLKDCVDIGHLIRRVYGCTNGGQTIS